MPDAESAMFTLTTVRGAMSLLSVALVVVVIGACTPPAPEVTAGEASDEEIAEANADEVEDSDGSNEPVTEEEAAEEVIEDAEETADGVLASLGLDACHDHADAGGASDGVMVLVLANFAEGSPVTVTLTTQDGAGTEIVTGTVGEDGRTVLLVPLSYFGEVVEVTEVKVADQALELDGLDSTSFTVAPESTCDDHPKTSG